MKPRSFARGFTVLEILIVIAVFGLLATLAVLSLNNARARVRDAQRLSDVSTLRNVLSQYWLDKATYPVSGGVNLGQPGTNTDAFTSAGFVARENVQPPVYLERVNQGPKAGEFYRYKGSSNGYSIRFVTESQTPLGQPGVYYAHASGIDVEDVEK